MTVKLMHLSCAALDALQRESEGKHPNETGGILVGRFQPDGVLVEYIVGPGPEAMHTRSGFRRDGVYAQRELDRVYGQLAGTVDYVGEWHSHPFPVGPSPRDARSMRWVADNPRYAPENPVLIIMQRIEPHVWRAAGFQWRRRRLERLHVVTAPRVCEQF